MIRPGLARLPLLAAAACLALGACAPGRHNGAPEPAASPSAPPPAQPREVTFPSIDRGSVVADEYGAGPRAVVLVHGGRFDKSSWSPQARALAAAGFRVLAIDLRGYGRSTPGSAAPDRYDLDVLGAVRYLRSTGAASVSIVGASLGGGAAAQASVESSPGEIDRIVLLAHSSIDAPERIQSRTLFITTRDDLYASGRPRLDSIRDQFNRAPEPKSLVILDGSAHAQHAFATDQGDALMAEILRFLSEP